MSKAARAFGPFKAKTTKFTLYQLTVALVKEADLHEGLWQLQVVFGQSAANLSINGATTPTAVVQVMGVQLGRVDKVDILTVNAAEVNPGSRIIMPTSVN